MNANNTSPPSDSLYVKLADAVFDVIVKPFPSERLAALAKRCSTIHKARNARWAEEIYVLGVTVLLFVAWLAVDDNSTGSQIVMWLVIIRGFEVLVGALGLVLDKKNAVIGHNLLTVVLYGLQVPLIMAIVMRVAASTGFSTAANVHPANALDFLYIAWTNMTTLGSDYFPTTQLAKELVMINGAGGVILLGVILTMAVGQLGGRRGDCASAGK